MQSSDQAVSRRLTLEKLVEVRTSLAQRPPDAALTAAEAAIYTGRSTRTLKRALDAGVGPRREKNPDISGLAATNRHTRYRKADLDQWREGLIGFTTIFWDFDDLAVDAPWLLENDRIVGHLMDLEDIDAVLQALGADNVVFLRLDEALRQSWARTQPCEPRIRKCSRGFVGRPFATPMLQRKAMRAVRIWVPVEEKDKER